MSFPVLFELLSVDSGIVTHQPRGGGGGGGGGGGARPEYTKVRTPPHPLHK